ncbi:helix-turn-helix domain-containing protein [Erythrobacter sp. THAF29]|uniref:helix-turn-helix domain-containing protein n=1 Tax=Erythrobacter sp. THAF29 TaxID=2587851 RepID=UPI001268E526|nr:helix-turn-helix domain-containing protein [Erythrobacter sp. THAF29]QFT76026.1 Helix-turn-helix protein [Erythrobacter sp. THAF29]
MALKAHIAPAPSTLDDRREARRDMQLETSGTLPSGLEANVTVHNLSSSGLLLETDLPLEEDEILAIELPEHGPVEARIVWHSDSLYGCAFDEELPASVLAAAELQGELGGGQGIALTTNPGTISEAFGTRLNRLRRERGLTLAQVADALDVSKPTVWAWEKGKARPLPERIEAIAEALGVSVADLAESRDGDKGRSVIEDCRLRIATAYGTQPRSIRIMIEI